jgi:hypothetical protein
MAVARKVLFAHLRGLIRQTDFLFSLPGNYVSPGRGCMFELSIVTSDGLQHDFQSSSKASD